MLYARGDGLLVVDVRGALVDLHAEFTAQTVHDDVEMELAHTADNGLAGLVVGLDGESRILLRQLGERNPELVEVLLRFGLLGDTDDGIGELH